MSQSQILDLEILLINCRRQPGCYHDEFKKQFKHYESCLELFLLHPKQDTTEFEKLVFFVSQISEKYKKETQNLSKQFIDLLKKHAQIINKKLRTVLVKALITLKKYKMIKAMDLYPELFQMFHVQDKSIKELIFNFLISDIKLQSKITNKKSMDKDMKIFLFNIIKSQSTLIAKKTLALLAELWRRQVWRDENTVNVMSNVLWHDDVTLMQAGIRFFLGYDIIEELESDDSEDEGNDDNSLRQQINQRVSDIRSIIKKNENQKKLNKLKKHKNKAKLRHLDRSLRKKVKKDLTKEEESALAIRLFAKPQEVIENLYSRIHRERLHSDKRLICIQLICRIIGIHHLILLNIYPFLINFMHPNHVDCVTILTSLVHACHRLVPPDALEPIIRHLSNKFIDGGIRGNITVAGLKTIREVCVRCPWAMPHDILDEILSFRKSRDLQIKAAANSVISIIRELAPDMLRKKDKGNPFAKIYDSENTPKAFGEVIAHKRIIGADLLENEISDTDEISDGEEFDSVTEDEDNLTTGHQDKKTNGSLIRINVTPESTENEELPLEVLTENEELPLEMTRFLDDEELKRIDSLKYKELVKQIINRTRGDRNKASAREKLEAETNAEALLKIKKNQEIISEDKIKDNDLLGNKREKQDKSERMLKRKVNLEEEKEKKIRNRYKRNTAKGLSNRQKEKMKILPRKVKSKLIKKRIKTKNQKLKSRKRFKGHYGKGFGCHH